MKKKKDKALQSEILEIFAKVKEVVNSFKNEGASELVMNWVKDVEEWTKKLKIENYQKQSLIFTFEKKKMN